jgi:DNA-binding beta-propeller fold protein YncE
MNQRSWNVWLGAAATVLAFATGSATLGCGAAGANEDALDSGGPEPGAGGNGNARGGTGGTGAAIVPPGSGGTAGAGGSEPPPPPPEAELESAFEAPVATRRFVWTANPDTGKVALIDAETFSVRLAEVGLRPTTVAALPNDGDADRAIVLNQGSQSATVLQVAGEEGFEQYELETHAGANAIAVSPSGRYAVAWTNAAALDPATLDPTDGFQDVTVLDLGSEPHATVLSIGYRPSRVAFDADETRAFVVTEPGLSVLELADAPRADQLIELTDDPVATQNARDVSITPDGKLALVRVDGERSLGIVDLRSAKRDAIDLGDFITDLDLASDGKRAFAVVGQELVAVPVPPGSTNPKDFPRASVAGGAARSVSLSPNAELALLYSNAAANPYLSVLTTDDGWRDFSGRALDLKAPIEAVFASPSARHGIAFQSTASGSRKAGAFSIVSAESERAPKIIGTEAAPFQVAFTPDGEAAVVATRDLSLRKYGMYLVRLANLEEDFVSLPSPPLSAGMVPAARRAFVAQAHPEGRITFVDLDSGAHRTLTGFELGSEVVE